MNYLLILGHENNVHPDVIARRLHLPKPDVNTVDAKKTTAFSVYECSKDIPIDWADTTIVAGYCNVTVKGSRTVIGPDQDKQIIDLWVTQSEYMGDEGPE